MNMKKSQKETRREGGGGGGEGGGGGGRGGQPEDQSPGQTKGEATQRYRRALITKTDGKRLLFQ
ncbi:hypothetical protein E2C01_096748 [Portunus trituberculatus]|uniref:Uncharacterized protein n=1 Tax=Portunus trituberculatus TaxID=210409 RepID=A0A5B7K2K4_PORTR|nr:hypothetical protein [Portunus trituberculatus]